MRNEHHPLALNEQLLLLLNVLDHFNIQLQGVSNSVRRCQCKPLSQGNIGYAVALV